MEPIIGAPPRHLRAGAHTNPQSSPPAYPLGDDGTEIGLLARLSTPSPETKKPPCLNRWGGVFMGNGVASFGAQTWIG
jgi:hypothetical protein